MNSRELETALAAADPIDEETLAGLDFAAIEATLLDDLEGTPSPPAATASGRARSRRRKRPAADRARRRLPGGGGRPRHLPARRRRPPSGRPPPTAPTSSASPNRPHCSCSKSRAGGSRTSTRTTAGKGPKARWNSSPADRFPTNRSRSPATSKKDSTSRECSPPRCAGARSNSYGATPTWPKRSPPPTREFTPMVSTGSRHRSWGPPPTSTRATKSSSTRAARAIAR